MSTFSQMPSYGEVIEHPIENKVPTLEEKSQAKEILGLNPNKKHIINVGLWTSGKNQKEGVELAKQLEQSNPEIQFHFVGNQAINFAEYWGPIMSDIPSNVTVWGERHDTDLFMRAADVFMFNSTWECNPLVVREAISHGLKIISRNLPQYMDMFTPYITQINDDIVTTKNKLLSLLDSESTYQVIDGSSEFENKYVNFYKSVKDLPITSQTKFIPKPEIIQYFVNNPFLEIKGESNSKFKVEFYDESGRCHYSEELSSNHWIRLNRQYFTKWNTKIWESGKLIYDNTLDLKGKKVLQLAIDPDYSTVMKQPDSIIKALSFLGGLLTIINITFLIKWLNYCNVYRRIKSIVYNMSILNEGGGTTDKLNLT
jgi:hypothetical protein